MKELPPLAERAALVRTRLALERTLMAWLRTAIAMITFGFTLYKALEYAHTLGLKPSGGLFSITTFSLIMVGMGLVALVLATLQHIRYARTMRALDLELPVFTPGVILALMFAVLGLFALVGVILHTH